ncbi:hypothetical protein H0H93_009876, partial [Arthromyces matolae]
MLLFLAYASLLLLKRLFRKTDLDNVPGPIPESFIKGIQTAPPSNSVIKSKPLEGNIGQLFDVYAWNFNAKLAEKFGRVTKIHGMFGTKYLYLFDPKALHHIIVKDQVVYEETSSFLGANKIMFGEGLLSTQVPMFQDVANRVCKTLMATSKCSNVLLAESDSKKQTAPRSSRDDEMSKYRAQIDILHWMTRAALEMIGQSGLGYSFDTLIEGDLPHPFSEAAKAF